MKKYIQVLGAIACLAVVLLHTNGVFWIFSYERYWATANVIESVCYFAVPVFLMISGCNLIDYRKKYDTKTYFKKRILKTGIPFVIWSLIGCSYRVMTHAIDIKDLNISWIINSIFNTNIIGIYWFFMPLFSIYLAIPALALIPEKSREKIFRYLLITAFVFNMCFPFIFVFLPINYNGSLYMPLVSGYVFYALAGYYIDRYPIGKKYRIGSYILGVLGLTLHIGGTFILSYADGAINETFKGYLNIPCVLYTIAIFIFFKYFDKTKVMDLLYKCTAFVADTTFGVYLIHWFLMDVVLRVTHIHPTSIIYRTVGGFGIFIIAVLIVKVIKKVPVICRIVP